jgi:hypothetical protein
MEPSKPNLFFQTKEEIITWLDLMKIKNYTLNPDLTVDVEGDVFLNDNNLITLPLQFGQIKGSFCIMGNGLESLKGCPKKITGAFDCSNNNLTSLEYFPQKIEASIYLHINLLTSLEGINIKEVKGEFFCNKNYLTSLKYIPEIISGTCNCSDNDLISLDDGPKKVGIFYINSNKLKSLNNCPEILHSLYAQNNELVSLEGCPEIILGKLDVSCNQLTDLTFSPLVAEELNCSFNPITTLKDAPQTLGYFNISGLNLEKYDNPNFVQILEHFYGEKEGKALKYLESFYQKTEDHFMFIEPFENLKPILEKIKMEEMLTHTHNSNKKVKI